jgi:2-hydroxychromene-2-carboxylate isomerase
MTEKPAAKTRWLFDVVSPFAYLAFPRLRQLPAEPEFVPVLLAALLDHHGQRGPAEIPSKRRFTYRFVLWRARQLGMTLRLPPAHPFNPLAALRLIIAARCSAVAVGTVLDAIFRDGRDVSDPGVIAQLGESLGIQAPLTAIAAPEIKQQLRANTDWAIQQGIFGVPTLVVGGEFFWGQDAVEMALDYLRSPQVFDDEEMRAVDTLPVGARRAT